MLTAAKIRNRAKQECELALPELDASATEEQCLEQKQAGEETIQRWAELGALSDEEVARAGQALVEHYEARNAILKEVKEKKEKAQKEKMDREIALKSLFDMYDTDGKGRLTADDVLKMAQGEYQVDVPHAEAARMVKQLDPEKKGGIPLAKVAQLQNKLRVLSDIEKARIRKEKDEVERQEWEAKCEQLRPQVEAKLEEDWKLAGEAEASVVLIETACKALKSKVTPGQLKLRRATEAQAEFGKAQELISAARESVLKSLEECNQDELGPMKDRKPDFTKVSTRVGVLQSRLGTAQKLAAGAREQLSNRQEELAQSALAAADNATAALAGAPASSLAALVDKCAVVVGQVKDVCDGVDDVQKFAGLLGTAALRAVGFALSRSLEERGVPLNGWLEEHAIDCVGLSPEAVERLCSSLGLAMTVTSAIVGGVDLAGHQSIEQLIGQYLAGAS